MRTSLSALIPAVLLSACLHNPNESVVNSSAPQYRADAQGQLHFGNLASGHYNCEFDQDLILRRVNGKVPTIELSWKNKSYTLTRDLSTSGLPRYEDKKNHLTWIDLPWKGVLLNSRTRKPLVSDCVAA